MPKAHHPYYNAKGIFIDPCIVCGVYKCKNEHTEGEIEVKVQKLQKNKKAGKKLFSPENRPPNIRLLRNSEHFWSAPTGQIKGRNYMSYADHAFEGFIRDYMKKGLSHDQARERARNEVDKILNNNKKGVSNLEIPEIGVETKEAIKKWKPRWQQVEEAEKRKRTVPRA